MHHDRLKSCPDANIPLWARRDRARLFAGDNGEPDCEAVDDDMGLTVLFDGPVDSLQHNTPDRPVAVSNDAEYASNESEETISPELPPSRSGRRRRRPTWQQDYSMY